MYNQTIRTKKVDDYIVDRMMLDRVKVYEDRQKFNSGKNAFLKDYWLEYYYNRYIEKWDKRIFDEIEKAMQKLNN